MSHVIWKMTPLPCPRHSISQKCVFFFPGKRLNQSWAQDKHSFPRGIDMFKHHLNVHGKHICIITQIYVFYVRIFATHVAATTQKKTPRSENFSKQHHETTDCIYFEPRRNLRWPVFSSGTPAMAMAGASGWHLAWCWDRRDLTKQVLPWTYPNF